MARVKTIKPTPIMITGKTYEYRDILIKLGAKFVSARKVWIISPSTEEEKVAAIDEILRHSMFKVSEYDAEMKKEDGNQMYEKIRKQKAAWNTNCWGY